METINKSFSIHWLEPNRAFLITVHAAQLNAEDIAAIQEDTSVRYRKASRKLHVVIDLRSLDNRTSNDLQGTLGNIRPVTMENRGETIIIVSPDSPLVEFMTGATMQGLRLPFHLCHNKEEALKILEGIEDDRESPTEPSHLPYSIKWYISNRVLLITVLGAISGEEVHQMATEAFKHIRKAPAVVHAIVDLRGLSARPDNLKMAFQDVWRRRHPNQGTSVIVMTSMHPVAKFVCTTVMGSLRLKYEFCDSMDEARDRIAKLEDSRPKV